MAAYEGEMISRAVEDDEDEDENQEYFSVRARWSPLIRAELLKTGGKLPCKFIIVAVGIAASGFVKTYIVQESFSIIGALFTGMKDINTLTQQSPTEKTCYVYHSESMPDILAVICNRDLPAEQSYSFVHELFSAIDISECCILILAVSMTSDYRSEVPVSDMAVPFMRALRTTKYLMTPLCPYLEQPNIISGLQAQLLTYCQLHNAKAILYNCYTDRIDLEVTTMKAFLPLLKSTPVKDYVLANPNPKADETLLKLVELHSAQNMLYL
ncbi:hypothetical protein CHS0354_034185 [Potamilus streckersoni]|uniref:Proteasome assembly chaperone 1 n=1 Tax=Potamilus streckersoni TaxID=2493646 RepID=A0AAE0VG75_9BIVA|nr:hypothetical protein CHS0354_034185 [Potamilus streckersoni]